MIEIVKRLFGRAGYEIIPDYEAFVRGSYNTVDYDDAVDDLGIDCPSSYKLAQLGV